MHIPVFRVFYNTTFTVLLLILLALLLVTPGDAIAQSYPRHQVSNIIIIACVYVATCLVAGFVYATRIYTTRTHLISIPRSRAPIKKADISAAVREVIREGLARSASIAWNAHPKDWREQLEKEEQGSETEKSASPRRPPWGVIEHAGWSSPASADLSDVQFSPVIAELVNLLEAKAVSLAPADPLVEQDNTQLSVDNEAELPDANAVELLQRPLSMGAREYLFQLMELGVIRDGDLAAAFLKQYEAARFSSTALSEAMFRQLMSTFSALLGALAPPDLSALTAARPASTTSTSPPLTSQPSATSLRRSSRASSVLHRFASAQQYVGPTAASGQETGGAVQPSTTPGGASSDRDSRPLRGLHLTPYFTPRPGSLSSNDGDHDSSSTTSKSSDSSAHTIHTAWTRPSRSSRTGNRSASRRPPLTRGSSSYFTPRLDSRHSSREDLDVVSVAGSEGSVVRRVRTDASAHPGERRTPANGSSSRARADYFGRWG